MQNSPHKLLSHARIGNQKDLPNIPLLATSRNLLQSIFDHVLDMIGYRGSIDVLSASLLLSCLSGKSESTK
jgi:hypothetical protein